MRRLQIRHETVYNYLDEVPMSCHSARLEPRAHGSQGLLKAEWTIDPEPVDLTCHLDPFGNPVHLFRIDRHHTLLSIVLEMLIEVSPRDIAEHSDSIWSEVSKEWARFPHLLPRETWPHLVPTGRAMPNQAILDYFRECLSPQEGVLKGCMKIMNRIYEDFEFDPDFTQVGTPIAVAFEHRKGVCQDFSHLMLAGLRGLGIPARYVSGYLETLPPPGKEKLVGVDASHAWVEVYTPEVGWVELDPTNNMVPGDRHVVIAVGRDYDDVSPVKGLFHGGSDHQLEVKVDVREVEVFPRLS